MNVEATDFWERAKKALTVAHGILALDSDAAASRAYYAAFYAVSAHFALQGRTFTKHSAVEAAVHRDLVQPGTWRVDMGRGYSRLVRLRRTGDYGVGQHVPPDQAEQAVQIAAAVLRAVAGAHGDTFTGLEDVLPPGSGA